MNKLKIDSEDFLANYNQYEYLTDYMWAGQKGNWNKPGVSDYPLYAYLSTLFNDTTILEIGTCLGGSALMMSHNESNNIISYDIAKHSNDVPEKFRNIEFRIGNFMNDNIDYTNIRFLTIDAAHTGREEVEMVKHLESVWEGGLLFLDDIHNNAGGSMQEFWDGIDRDRHDCYDFSELGHGSRLGTGIVNFNKYYDLEII